MDMYDFDYDYNYEENVKKDVAEYVEEEYYKEDWIGNREGLEQKAYEDMFCADSVTGNGSGSYTFNTYKAEKYICHNLDLLAEAAEEFGTVDMLTQGAEACDVTIRCYLLGRALSEVLDDLEKEGYFEEPEMDEDLEQE